MEYFQVRYFVKKFDSFDRFSTEDYKEILPEIANAVDLLGSINPEKIFNKNQIQVAISSTNNMIWEKAWISGAGQLSFGKVQSIQTVQSRSGIPIRLSIISKSFEQLMMWMMYR